MNDFRLLKILDLLKPLFQKFSIDYTLLRSFLTVKLLIDERQVPTVFHDSKEQDGNPFYKSLWIYALYSLLLVYFLFGESYMLQMSILFGLALVILLTAFIADFSELILDTKDQTITATKPVDQRTIAVAKIIHSFIYFLFLTLAITIIPILVMLFVQGILFTLLFIFILILFTLFTYTATSLVYLAVLKVYQGSQLKHFITYAQIILAVTVMIGYQVMIRSYGLIDLNTAYVFEWWHVLFPPTWFAAPFELIINQNGSTPIILLSFGSLFATAILIVLFFRLLPSLENKLPLEKKSTNKKERISLIEKAWGKALCKNEETRTFFQFVYRMVQRDRVFKLKVFPLLGIGLVLPFIFPFALIDSSSLEEIAAGSTYFYIYLLNLFIGIALYTFQFSSSSRGAWIFVGNHKLSPPLFEAVMKVFLVKLYVPIFLLTGGSYYLFFHRFQLVDLVIVFVSAVIQGLLSYKFIMKSPFPFLLSYEQSTDNKRSLDAFLLILLAIPFALVHILVSLVPYGVYAYAILLLFLAIYLWRSFFEYKEHA